MPAPAKPQVQRSNDIKPCGRTAGLDDFDLTSDFQVSIWRAVALVQYVEREIVEQPDGVKSVG
jgi:hypothetical protein